MFVHLFDVINKSNIKDLRFKPPINHELEFRLTSELYPLFDWLLEEHLLFSATINVIQFYIESDVPYSSDRFG
jgi:hypothetical protein